MGIRGLTGWIRWTNPQGFAAPDWKNLHGKTVGVDILGQLYKIKAQRSCPLKYMAEFIAHCKKLRITPVFIFDGKPPEAKRAALKERSALRESSLASLKVLETEVAPFVSTMAERAALEARIKALSAYTTFLTSEERDLCKQLCYACGVMCLNATGEADDVLAHLTHAKAFDAVISSDLDLLTRGVHQLLVPQTWSMPGDADGWVLHDLPAILHKVSFTYDQFVEMCVLMGSDYTVGLRSLPYKSAYWAIKYRGELLKTLEVLGVPDETPYVEAGRRLKGLCETEESLMGEKQWTKLKAGAPPLEPASLDLFFAKPLKSLSPPSRALLYGSTDNDTSGSLDNGCDRATRPHDHPESSDCQKEQNQEQNGGKQDVGEDPVNNVRYDRV
jgi:flap endonuclease-1